MPVSVIFILKKLYIHHRFLYQIRQLMETILILNQFT